MNTILLQIGIQTALIVFFPLLILSKSQDTLHLDLAMNPPGSVLSIQGNRNYEVIVLKNVLNCSYMIKINKSTSLIEPLNDSPFQPTSSNLSGTDSINCPSLKSKMDSLKEYQRNCSKEKSENKLSQFVKILKDGINLSNCSQNDIDTANNIISLSQRVYNKNVEINTGDKVTITIKRDTLEWTFILLGDELGQWITSYGFVFTSKRLETPSYFIRQIPDTSLYKITKAEQPEIIDLSYIPAVFFSYFPSSNYNNWMNFSFTAGLGFDLSAPVIFLGINLMYYSNIGISTGVAFQQQNRLKTKYSENEVISSQLETDQLYDKVYRPNIFIAINFRFGENPFKANKEKDNLLK